MKLTGLLEVVSTYKMYVSEFLSWGRIDVHNFRKNFFYESSTS